MKSTPIARERDAGAGPAEPSRFSFAEELAGLMTEPFWAEHGCFRQAGAIGLYVSSGPGAAPGSVNLLARVFARSFPEPESALEQQTRTMLLKLDLRLLHHRRPAMRVSACRRLSRLGCDEVRDALWEVARADVDEEVRAAAAAALDHLAMPVLERGVLAGIELHLIGGTPENGQMLRKARTDGAGCARFDDIPKGTCRLQLAATERWRLTVGDFAPPVAGPTEPVAFAHTAITRGRLGHLCLEIAPRPHGDSKYFDAVVRLSAPESAGRSRQPAALRPVVRKDRDFYQLSYISEDRSVLTFDELPLGNYDLLWHDTGGLWAHDSILLAKGAAPAEPPPFSLDASCGLVVHPADRRLLAIVEPERDDSVVLTVGTDTPGLENARVRYGLGGETGELRLVSDGRGASRAVCYLSQPFARASALSLSLEIIS